MEKKFQCRIRLESILPYGDHGLVAQGFMVTEDPGRRKFYVGEYIRTSFIIKVDAEKRIIETLNTIYSY